MVEGHRGEEVVHDVCVGDMVEGVVEDGAEGPVDGAEGAAEPGPLLVAEVRRVHIYSTRIKALKAGCYSFLLSFFLPVCWR